MAPSTDFAKQLALLLGDFSSLAHRIRCLDYDCSPCGTKISVRSNYPAFQDGEPSIDQFVDLLTDHIISFCLPRSEIMEARNAVLATGDLILASRKMQSLSDRARQLFIRAKKGSSRSGEAGEILLYILNEWILKAPQIVSKMYLKTNSNMPVHGTDGIHLHYDEQLHKLIVYWGESKVHETLSSALSAALSSISDFVTNSHEKREIELISSHPDLTGFTDEGKKALLRYFDPYDAASQDRVSVFSCLLVFESNFKAISSDDAKIEAEFIDLLNKTTNEFITSIAAKVTAQGLNVRRFCFFLLPVPSVQDFRDKFQAKIGWPA